VVSAFLWSKKIHCVSNHVVPGACKQRLCAGPEIFVITKYL